MRARRDALVTSDVTALVTSDVTASVKFDDKASSMEGAACRVPAARGKDAAGRERSRLDKLRSMFTDCEGFFCALGRIAGSSAVATKRGRTCQIFATWVLGRTSAYVSRTRLRSQEAIRRLRATPRWPYTAVAGTNGHKGARGRNPRCGKRVK